MPPPQHWRIGRHVIPLDRPRVIAILNVTPDSFFEGSRSESASRAVEAARRFVAAGADVIDIGGESTRPGSVRVSPEEQTQRVVPAIESIRAAGIPTPITVDTTRAEVASAALRAGADGINDVSAGQEDAGMLALAAETGAGLILMHRLRPPDEDRYSTDYVEPPEYTDVVGEIGEELSLRAQEATDAGVPSDAIALDPGLGFGKTVEQNLELVRRTGELCAFGYPIVSAASRKSFVGAVSGASAGPADRLHASIACSICHLRAGAMLFRVHDVEAQSSALRAAWAIDGGVSRSVASG